MSDQVYVLFGGTGFIGRALTKELCKHNKRVRIVSRQPHRVLDMKLYGNTGQIEIVQGNLRYPDSIENVLSHADGVVNLVGLLYEKGTQNFKNIHLKGAENLADCIAKHKIRHFVHISALGANPESNSHYAKTKGQAETLIRNKFPDTVILRPSLVYGPKDGFFNRFSRLADLSPILPLLGGGKTKFQPVYVNDLAKAILECLENKKTNGNLYEIGGNQQYSFEELIKLMLKVKQQNRLLMPIPWLFAEIMGYMGQIIGSLPFITPFLTRDQVELLKSNNIINDMHKGIASTNLKKHSRQNVSIGKISDKAKVNKLTVNGYLKDLNVRAESVESVLPTWLVPNSQLK